MSAYSRAQTFREIGLRLKNQKPWRNFGGEKYRIVVSLFIWWACRKHESPINRSLLFRILKTLAHQIKIRWRASVWPDEKIRWLSSGWRVERIQWHSSGWHVEEIQWRSTGWIRSKIRSKIRFHIRSKIRFHII